MTITAARRIPFVDYLVIDDGPAHLVANECPTCGARFFERRNACAACFGVQFAPVKVPTEGTVRSFTIVTFAAPGVDVPFIAGVIDCSGTTVAANIINCPPDPAHVQLGMSVRLVTVPVGLDDDGVEAIAFGFEPAPADARKDLAR